MHMPSCGAPFLFCFCCQLTTLSIDYDFGCDCDYKKITYVEGLDLDLPTH